VTLTASVDWGITCIFAGFSLEQNGVENSKLVPFVSGTGTAETYILYLEICLDYGFSIFS
jgi:hypothetical protein